MFEKSYTKKSHYTAEDDKSDQNGDTTTNINVIITFLRNEILASRNTSTCGVRHVADCAIDRRIGWAGER